MIKINQNEIRITRGDSAVINLAIYKSDGETPYTPTENDHIYFTIKSDINNEYYDLKKLFVNGETLTISKDDTIGLNFGTYFYDVRLENNNNYDTIIDQGTIIIEGGTANARN